MTSNIRLIQEIIMPVILLAPLSPPALDGNLACTGRQQQPRCSWLVTVALPVSKPEQLCRALGSGQRYQILLHVFAHCTNQKTYCHARITRDSRMAVGFLTRAVLFWHGHRFFDSRNVQKYVTQIIYLGPLPTGHIFRKAHPSDLKAIHGHSEGTGLQRWCVASKGFSLPVPSASAAGRAAEWSSESQRPRQRAG